MKDLQAGYYVLPHRLEIAARLDSVAFGRSNCPDSLRNTFGRSLGVNWYFRGHNIKLQSDYTWLRLEPFAGFAANSGQFRVQTQFSF